MIGLFMVPLVVPLVLFWLGVRDRVWGDRLSDSENGRDYDTDSMGVTARNR